MDAEPKPEPVMCSPNKGALKCPIDSCPSCAGQEPSLASGLCKNRGVFLDDLLPEELDDPTVYIPRKYSSRLFLSSQALIIPAVASIYFGCYGLASCSVMVYLTSLNHWRKPRRCWRRHIDIGMVYVALACHGVQAWLLGWPFGFVWWLACGLVSFLYVNGRRLGSRGHHEQGIKRHFMVHILGSLFNTVLYYWLYLEKSQSNTMGLIGK